MNLIQFHGNAEQSVTYYRVTAAGEYTEKMESSSLRTLAPFLHDAPLVVLLPTAPIFLTSMDLPQVSTRELLLGVPFALEEQFAQNLSDLYFAVQRSEKTKLVSVATLEKKLFEAYVAFIQECGMHAETFLPTVLALPWKENQWTLSEVDGFILLRLGECQGMAIEPDNLLLMLNTAANNGENLPEKIVIYGETKNVNVLALSKSFPEKMEQQDATRDIPFSTDALENPSFNLLQGSYRPKPKLNRLQKYWRRCSYLVVIGILFMVLGNLADYFYYNWEASHLHHQISVMYKNAFSGAALPEDVQGSMQKALAKLELRANDNEFNNLFGPFGAVLYENVGVTLHGFEYRMDHLIVIITAKSEEDVQTMIQELNQRGLATKILKTKSQGDTGVGMELSIEKQVQP